MPTVPAGPSSGSATVHALLEAAHVPHRLIDHPATFRARDEARAADLPPGRVAKTIVVSDHGRLWLAVIPANRRIDLRRLRTALAASTKLRLATERELKAAFPQFDVGALPPLGELIGVKEVVDPRLLDAPMVLTPAGDHTHGVLVDPDDLLEAAGAQLADICDDEEGGRAQRFSDAPPI